MKEKLEVEIDGKKYPVYFKNEHRDWAWTKKDWIGKIENIPIKTLSLSKNIEIKYRKIDTIRDHPYLKEYLVDLYSKELRASWAIEGERLDSLAVRSFLAKKIGLNVPEWRLHKNDSDNEKEKIVVDVILSLLNPNKKLTVQEILKTHGLLKNCTDIDGDLGEFRQSPEIVGNLSPQKDRFEIIYEAPDPKDVPLLMQHYVSWWHRSQTRLPTPLAATLAHLYFVEIHPFHDGNGRMARLLTNKYLASSSFPAHAPQQRQADLSLPYMCISNEILRKSSQYFEYLDKYSRYNNYIDFIDYSLNMYDISINEMIKKITPLKNLYNFFLKHKGMLTDTEKTIIRNSYIAEGIFLSFKVLSKNIDDKDQFQIDYNNLKQAGIIGQNGKPVLDDELVNNLLRIKENKQS